MINKIKRTFKKLSDILDTLLILNQQQSNLGFFAIAALALIGAGTGVAVKSSLAQGKAARKAERARAGAEELRAARERLRVIREARIRRAQIQAQAEQQGVAASSVSTGAQASIGTQTQANLGFIASQQQAAREISSARLKQARAQTFGALGQQAIQFGAVLADFDSRRQKDSSGGQSS